MSFYNRELQSNRFPRPVIFEVVQHAINGFDGMPRIEFVHEDEWGEYEYAPNIYPPWKVICVDDDAATEWQQLYRWSQLEDLGEQESARMNEIEKQGTRAFSQWQLLVNAPEVIGRFGQMYWEAVQAWDAALKAAEELGLSLSEEDKEQQARLGLVRAQYGDPYLLATRLADLETRFFPAPAEEVREEVVGRRVNSQSSSLVAKRPSANGSRPTGIRQPRPTRKVN